MLQLNEADRGCPPDVSLSDLTDRQVVAKFKGEARAVAFRAHLPGPPSADVQLVRESTDPDVMREMAHRGINAIIADAVADVRTLARLRTRDTDEVA